MKVGIASSTMLGARALELVLRQLGYELAWCETEARRALERLGTRPPELLLLDSTLRSPSSTELTRAARVAGVTVLLVTAGELQTTAIYDAMASGAVDVSRAPALDARGELVDQTSILTKLRMVARLLGRSQSRPLEDFTGRMPSVQARPLLIAIGASTGGPNALHRVLSKLPADLEAAIVLVQHVDSTLIADLASFLQSATARRIELATAESRATAGRVLLAATDDHLVLTKGHGFRYEPEPRALPYRPSVDVLFNSLAEHWPNPGIAVLLTGMGRDGAKGLKRLRVAGWHTLAQDERTSVVYGMPKAAAELDAASRILPLDDIAPAIARAAFELNARRS